VGQSLEQLARPLDEVEAPRVDQQELLLDPDREAWPPAERVGGEVVHCRYRRTEVSAEPAEP
jgi:hypothetical protein